MTACKSRQSVTVSPQQVIEAEQPDHVRVTVQDGTDSVLEEPLAEGDELVGTVEEASVRVPFRDILRVEARRVSAVRTVGTVAAGIVFIMGVLIASFIHPLLDPQSAPPVPASINR